MKFFYLSSKGIPFLSVLLTIVMGCSVRVGGYPLLPALFLIPVYYWIVFRPDWLPLWSLFVIGLFYDALLGYGLGVSSLLLMLSALLAPYSRPFLNPHHFPLMWGGFALYSLGYLILFGFLMSGGLSLFVSWIYSIILYPLLTWVVSHLYLRLQAYV